MKILILTPLSPLKISGGLQNRVWNLWSRLAKIHQLVIVSSDGIGSEINQSQKNGIKFYQLPQNHSSFNYIKCAIFGIIPTFFKHNTKQLEEFTQGLCAKEKFHLIVADHLWLAPTVLKIPVEKKILLSHGFEFILHERWQKNVNLLSRQILRFLTRNMKIKEIGLLKQFKRISCVSAEEKKQLRELGCKNNHITVIPNGTNLPEISVQKTTVPIVLFLGSLDYLPNNDGLKFFINQILPRLEKNYPNFKFQIIGRLPKKWLEKINNPKINVLGYVPNIADNLSLATVCIAPLRMGGGSRLKILEYFSFAKAVVATTIGAEGIEYQNNKNIIIADQPNDFSQAIITLLKEEKLRQKIGQNARKLVADKYTWDIIARKLNSFISAAE